MKNQQLTITTQFQNTISEIEQLITKNSTNIPLVEIQKIISSLSSEQQLYLLQVWSELFFLKNQTLPIAKCDLIHFFKMDKIAPADAIRTFIRNNNIEKLFQYLVNLQVGTEFEIKPNFSTFNIYKKQNQDFEINTTSDGWLTTTSSSKLTALFLMGKVDSTFFNWE